MDVTTTMSPPNSGPPLKGIEKYFSQSPPREGAKDKIEKSDNYIRGPDQREGESKDPQELSAALNIALQSNSIQFRVDPDTEDIVIQIIDKESKEVVKQIPNREALALRKRLGDLRGLLLNQKV